jgi:hypothetical protein
MIIASGLVLPMLVTAKPTIFRAYFIGSGKFRILGDEFKVQSACHELAPIHNRPVFLVEHGGRFRELFG